MESTTIRPSVFVCFWCDKECPNLVKTKDHVVPKCNGGRDYVSNVVLACADCNQSRAAFTTLYRRSVELKEKVWGWGKGVVKIGNSKEEYAVDLFAKYNTKASEVKKDYDFWVGLEVEKVEESPTEDLGIVWEVTLENYWKIT